MPKLEKAELDALLRRARAARKYIAKHSPPLEERWSLLTAVVCPTDQRLIDWSKEPNKEKRNGRQATDTEPSRAA
jgi:hypothetical protein